MERGKTLKKIRDIFATIFFTFVFPQVGCKLADFCEYGFSIRWLYIHHSVQLLLALITIFLISISLKNKVYSWGFNFNNWQWSLKIASVFAIVWFVISLILNLIFKFPSQINYELTPHNIVSDLFFDFVLTGLSEEILFRGLIMGILLHTWKGNLNIGNFQVSTAGIITALLFALAHIGIDYESFTISNISPMQLIFAVGLGLFYAIMRDKTKSLLGPLIAHGVSDGLITVIQLIIISI
jgi:membrane protease YdiL (CAAX protease family)